jgi:hypothetical protein
MPWRCPHLQRALAGKLNDVGLGRPFCKLLNGYFIIEFDFITVHSAKSPIMSRAFLDADFNVHFRNTNVFQNIFEQKFDQALLCIN